MDDYDTGPAPIDSYDLYTMGLRAARCNGCTYLEAKWKLGERFVEVQEANGWITIYEKWRQPLSGQTTKEIDGVPVRFKHSFVSIGHSDECWHFQIPDHPYVPPSKATPETHWKTADGTIPITELTNTHLINILKMLRRTKGSLDYPGLQALRYEAHQRTITLTSGREVTIDQLVFPEKYKGLQGIHTRLSMAIKERRDERSN